MGVKYRHMQVCDRKHRKGGYEMIICVMGKSGSGKSTLVEELKNNMEGVFHVVRSFTTRSPRVYDPNDINTHVFVTEHYWELHKEQALAVYNSPHGYTSWTSPSSFESDKINLYVIDPKAFLEFRDKTEEDVIGIYVDIDEQTRMRRLGNRGSAYFTEEYLDKRLLKGVEGVYMIDCKGTVEECYYNVISLLNKLNIF